MIDLLSDLELAIYLIVKGFLKEGLGLESGNYKR
jgi:hypothetical protein